MNLQDLKLNNELSKEGLSLSKVASADYLYRNLAYALFIIFFIAAFFISLASASFDISKILEAQFWLDFSITFGGGMTLKWAFGKYGNFEGHKHEKVSAVLKEIETANKEIEERHLLQVLSSYVIFHNGLRKIKAIRRKVFSKLNISWSRKAKWNKQKAAVKIAEDWIMAQDGSAKKEELRNKLDELDFDLESYKIKYPYISETTLKTGFSSKEEDDEKMSFNEYYELFGKNSLVTVLSVALTMLLAVSSVVMEDISMKTAFVFATRIAMFVLNSYIGFVVARSAVETVKLNMLTSITKFLNTFLEENSKPIDTGLDKVIYAKAGGEQYE